MKILWRNGVIKVLPTNQPAFMDYKEHKQAEENLLDCLARQRHKTFTLN